MLVALALSLGVVACGTATEESTVADEAMAAVCDALASLQQSSPDRAAAEAAFHDRAHDAVHELADIVEDRSVKGDLLEAKGAIESGDVSEDAVLDLIAAIERAAESLALDEPDPCDG